MYKKLCFVLFSFLILYSFQGYGQKVGLVLSGGGAKGLAHVGVIKALEENNIPIDYISGTSMGAIIGAMYSVGYSPERMEEIAVSDEFLEWANGQIEPKYSYYFKKNGLNPVIFSFKIETEDSIPKAKIPSSLVPTELIDLQLLSFYAAPAAKANYDFNNLFRPFRCVATDITNNKTIIFRKGNLEQAVRASMTFPFYYKPIQQDSIVYLDGGLKNNFPYEVLIDDFQPEYLIGSKTAKNAPRPDVDDVIGQLQNMLLRETDYSLPDSNGILINMELDSTELFNFRRAKKIIEKGYRTTLKMMDSIKVKIPVRKSDSLLQKERREYIHSLPHLTFHDVKVHNVKTNQSQFINNYLDFSDDHFGLSVFKQKYFKLLSDENISSIYPYSFYDSLSNAFTLNLRVDQTSKFVASLGGNISSSSINQGYAQVQYNHLGKYSKNIFGNVYYGRLYSSAKIAGRIDFPTQPEISYQTSFVLNRWDFYNSSNDPFFEDVRPPYLIKNENYFRNSLSVPLNFNGTLNVGLVLGSSQSKYYLKEKFLKSDTADRTTFDFVRPYFTYQQYNLNHKQFPTEGEKLEVEFSYVEGTEQFKPGSNPFFRNESSHYHHWMNMNIIYEKYFPLNQSIHLGIRLDANYSNKDFFTNYYGTLLNFTDYNPIPHSNSLFLKKFVGNSYIGTTINPIYNINPKFHLRLSLSHFLPYRALKSTANKEAEYHKPLRQHHIMGGASLVYHTVFGPASLNVNYYDKESKNWYFLFNFGFILFNEQGLK